jgi:hypothetical protein
VLHAFGALCLLVIAAAIILPTEIKVPRLRTDRGEFFSVHDNPFIELVEQATEILLRCRRIFS